MRLDLYTTHLQSGRDSDKETDKGVKSVMILSAGGMCVPPSITNVTLDVPSDSILQRHLWLWNGTSVESCFSFIVDDEAKDKFYEHS